MLLLILPEVLAEYFQEKEKEIKAIPLLERLIRLEEELKALRVIEENRFSTTLREVDKRFEAVSQRFEALEREMQARFEAINQRFEVLQKDMDRKFEIMNQRLEALEREMQARFEAINQRFEALERRLNFMQWLITVGFSFLALIITIINFTKG
ncbi:hypothetical protein [Thermocrinis jamiesonii]|uniref:hypothetical protein n=1 Tax=Thermocrinis jamiesonii TaxID=1302351 RepID=UPI0004956FB8|nr:hypothetical protein [Thermocrinis jamiesonii]